MMKDKFSDKEIENAINVLFNGGVILYPTDTIWGIGCDATNKTAVEKIFQIKKREPNKSMIVLIDSIENLNNYVSNMPLIAYDLMAKSDRPLTIIYADAMNLAENVIAADGSVAIRIPDSQFCKQLIKAFGKPIVSTSANFSGEASAVSFESISANLILQMDYVVQIMHHQTINTKPSRIIKIERDGNYSVIRA